jgi:hypothetical protein
MMRANRAGQRNRVFGAGTGDGGSAGRAHERGAADGVHGSTSDVRAYDRALATGAQGSGSAGKGRSSARVGGHRPGSIREEAA